MKQKNKVAVVMNDQLLKSASEYKPIEFVIDQTKRHNCNKGHRYRQTKGGWFCQNCGLKLN